MNNACKRLLSLFMAVAMVMSYVAVPVSAEDGDPQPPASCLGQAGVECTFDAHIEGCDKYEAPVTSCQGLAGVECTFDAHIEGCDKYEAPVTSCQGLAGVECTFDAHIEGCDKYAVPVTSCQGLAGVECAFDAHIEGCDKYVAPVTSCLGQAGVECTFDAHIEGCDKYEAPVTCNGTADCEAEAHNDGCAKAAADAAAKQVEEVEALIEALPTEEEVRAMDWNQLTALNTQITNISLKIDALGDHKSAVDTTGIAALAALLNERVMTLTETAVAKIGDTPYKTLAFAIEAAVANDTIILQDHIALAEGVTIPAGKNITIDLNGKTISRNTTVAATSAAITNNGTLTIKDSLTGGKITAFAANPDTAAIPYYASNTITNCGVLTVKSGTIENSTSDAARAAFPIDNNSTSRDAIVNIEGGTITGRGAIRQFANSTSHKNEVNITGGTVTGTSYGVWVQNPGSGDPVAALNISGEANVAKVLLSPSSNFDVAISGGTVSEVAIWSADTSNPSRNPAGFITGGNFRTDVSAFVALGYEYADGSVTQSTTIKVDTEDELTQAFAIADGRTITLLDDIELSETLTIPANKTVTLDLDTHTISQEKACTDNYSMIVNKGTLTITGNGKLSFMDTGSGDSSFGWGSYTIRNEGTLIVENGTIEHLGQQNASGTVVHMYCAIFQYSGSTTINGGTISTPTYRSVRLWKGSMTIDGGNFEGQLWVQAVDNTAKLTINNGTFGPKGPDGSSVFVTNDTYPVDVSITGGNFTTKIGASKLSDAFAGNITGGAFKTVDDSVFDVSAYVPVTHEQDMTTGIVSVKTEIKTEGNTETSFGTGVTETIQNEVKNNTAIEDKTVTDSVNASIGETKLEEIVSDLNTAGATSVQVTLKIKLETVTEDPATGTQTLSFDVEPYVQAVQESFHGGEKTVIDETKVSEVENPITFRLPMPNGTAGRIVNITHKHNDTETFLGAYTIEGMGEGETSTNCYVELASANFSDWVAEILPENVTDITAEVEGTPCATLQEALEHAGENDTIVLKAPVEIKASAALTINGNTKIDLNGQTLTLTGDATEKCLFIESGTTLITNTGTGGGIVITGTPSADGGYMNIGGGATLTLDNVDVTGTNYACNTVFYLGFRDESGATLNIQNGSSVSLNGNTWINSESRVGGSIIYANNAESTVNITDSTISGTDVGDAINNTTANITNSSVTLNATKEGGIDNGINGAALTLDDSTFTITGEGASGRGITSASGRPINIKGNSVVTLTDCGEGAIRFKQKGEIKVENTAALTAEGIVVDSEAAGSIVADTVLDATAGTELPSITKEANKPQAQPAAAIIQIDGMYHTGMSTAIPAMEAEGPHEVKLLANVEGGFTVQNDTTVTLDLNGFSITGNTDAAAAITVSGTLLVNDGRHTGTNAIQVPITVSANGGQFALNKPAAVGALNSSGMAYIYGGTVNGAISTESAGLVEIWGGNILGEMAGQVRVKGEPNGKLNEAVFANDPTEFCEDGFYGEKRTDGKYTIAEKDHMIVNGGAEYNTDLGNVIDTTDGGADSLLDIVLKKGDATITGEHAVKNGLDLLLDTEENKVTGGGSVTSEQVMQIVSNEADTVLPDGGKITFHSDAITYAPRYLDQEGYGRIDFSDHNGRKCYYLDKGATLTVTHKGEVSVTGKYILGNARGPIYTISISQDGPYDNRHYLGKDGDMTVTCNGFYGSVEKIWITGEKLDGKVHVVFEKGAALGGFEVEEGSTVVTLSKKYLNSLEKGDYKIHFQYKDHDDGEYVSEVFKVRTKSSYEADPTNPKTGDTILLPMAVMLTSAAALFVLVMNKKKHA